MFVFLTILILLAAILLILVVVIQNSKGGGLASGFAASNQIMGVRKTTDFLEKTTWWLAGLIALLSIGSTHFLHSNMRNQSNADATLQKQAEQKQPESLPILGGEDATAPATTSDEVSPSSTPAKNN